jgi:hypothetical protein
LDRFGRDWNTLDYSHQTRLEQLGPNGGG